LSDNYFILELYNLVRVSIHKIISQYHLLTLNAVWQVAVVNIAILFLHHVVLPSLQEL
jgi:hypothetical protein